MMRMLLKISVLLVCSSILVGLRTKQVADILPAKNPAGDEAKKAVSDKLVELVKKGSSTQLLAALIRGANPNHTDSDGVSLLAHARAIKSDKMADILIRYGADKDDLASLQNNTDTSADENSCDLHQAVLSGEVGKVKKLLAGGIDVNITDDLGRTALHHAAIAGDQNMVAELIDSGADTSIKDNLRRTAADYADFAMEESLAASLQPTDESDEDYEDIIDAVLAVREENKTCDNFNNL